jgi:hypothetical protein
MAMDCSARLFLCVRCRQQVILCSRCDHGQLYCSPSCSSAGRREHRRHSAQRYQDSRGGRLKHAARTACWRSRQRCLCLASPDASPDADVNKVTHQGCPPMQTDASLPACETTNAGEPIDDTSSAADVVLPSAPTPAWAAPRCRRCGCAVRPHLRHDGLRRRGVAPGGRHDHWP